MTALANTIELQNRYEEAKQHYEHILKLMEAMTEVDLPWYVCMRGLLSIMIKTGNYEKAEELQQRIMDQDEKVKGVGNSLIMSSMGRLADIMVAQEHFEEAEHMLKQTLERQEKALGIDSSSSLSTVLDLAKVQYLQGLHQDALITYHQGLQGYQRTLGPDNPETVRCLKYYNVILRESLREMGRPNTKEHTSIREPTRNEGASREQEETLQEYTLAQERLQ
ncbi:hypothetical protein MMC17_006400 [Xylographa soralifera]|nr:hypothetical protein [Xylographa soralifera]